MRMYSQNKRIDRVNILILSCGTRNSIVKYFKNELSSIGRVIAADCSNLAPALYDADKYYIIPKINDGDYLDVVLNICTNESIKGVLSLVDPELSILSLNQEKFSQIGVKVIGSSYELCEMALNKWKMFQWLSNHGYKTARSFNSKETFYASISNNEVEYPVIVKPTHGSASASVKKVYNKEMIELILSNDANLMIQEFMNGNDIDADCYIDMISGEVVSIFTKRKINMRAGEADKSVSIKDPALFDLLNRFIHECGFSGQIDVDLFYVNGEYYISEVNPRFGGVYPHAHECGVNSVAMIINNLMGNVNKNQVGNYDEGVYMMKYNSTKIMKF